MIIKAVLFDMDGVLADTETEWDRLGYDNLLIEHFGKELFDKVAPLPSGLAIKSIYDLFVEAGWNGQYDEFQAKNDDMGNSIYGTIPLSDGVNELMNTLLQKNIKLGIVSSAPNDLLRQLASRLAHFDSFSLTLSVNNHPTLKSKPAPDPYLHAMQELGVDASQVVVIEDSVHGVNSAKASGATVICYTEHNHGLEWQKMPENADYYAKSMAEVDAIVAKLLST